jgi:hypothetical protein
MKRILLLIVIINVIFGCKSAFKGQTGGFRIINYSDKVVEFIWIAPEGEFYPTVQSINVAKNDYYEVNNLDTGYYDIAIDFKGEYNSFNSKKDKNKLLYIEKGLTTVWYIDSSGNIVRQ